MTADVEMLRGRLQDYADGLGSPPVILHDVGELVTLLREADAKIEALEVQIAGLTAQVEHHTAYAITHRGVLRYCTSGMRDAYSDEKVRADEAEARAERLAEALREKLRLWRIREDGDEPRTEFDAGYEQASDECANAIEALLREQEAGRG